MAVYISLADAQPQTSSLAALGGEERLKDMRQNVGRMPAPLSATAISTLSSNLIFAAEMVILPPSGIACAAFSSRFIRICESWLASALDHRKIFRNFRRNMDVAEHRLMVRGSSGFRSTTPFQADAADGKRARPRVVQQPAHRR